MATVMQRHGASLAEFLILDVTHDGMPEDEAVKIAQQCLSSVTRQAVRTCLQNGWLLRCDNNLYVTPQGKRVAQQITGEIAESVKV
jgi:hypothetical protein